MSVPTIAITATSVFLAASVLAPCSGGSFSTVQTNHDHHRDEHRYPQQRPAPNQLRPDPRTDVDEGGCPPQRPRSRAGRPGSRPGNRRAPARRGSWASRWRGAQEASGRHEGQREQEDASIAAPLGRFTRCVAENERHAPDDPEDHEMRSIVLEVRVELGAKQQRDEANEWQRRQEERDGNTRHWSRMSLEQRRRPAVGIAPFRHFEETNLHASPRPRGAH